MTTHNGQRVLVTAGAGGIGRAIVRAFAEQGARVHACDIDEAALTALRAEVPGVSTSTCDVADRASVHAMIDQAMADLGGLDVLINNAGIAGPAASVADFDPAAWDAVLRVNLTGTFTVTQLAIPHLKQSEAGCILVMSSLAGRFDPCMWAGSTPQARADMTSAWSHAGPAAAHAAGAVALLQDFELLKIVIRAWIGVWLEKVDAGRIVPDQVDHLLCHYSARSLRQEIVGLLESTAAMIPEEKWFTTLSESGNVGSASIWVMLDAFLKSGRGKRGDKVLCIVPESGRAMIGFMMLEIV